MRVDAPAGPRAGRRSPEPPAYDPQALSFERFAKMEAMLRGEAPDDTGLDLDLIEQALARIYEIPTGNAFPGRSATPVTVPLDARPCARKGRETSVEWPGR